jgi:hypothetical protein
VEVRYEELIRNPEPALDAVSQLLGLPRRPAESLAVSPRLEPLLPAVAAVADAFRRELAAFPDASLEAVIPAATPEPATP